MPDRTGKYKSKSFFQSIDRAAVTLMVVLSLLTMILLLSGDRTAPRVRNFSWQDKQIGAEDTAFTLTFSRPMDQASVESNLHIQPSLPGKISWAGRKMAYTLTTPAPYGTVYKLELAGAEDKFSAKENKQTLIQPFISKFWTRDQAFVYVGVNKEDYGRLILYNLTKQEKTILTPNYLSVMDFKPYLEGDKILFSATDSRIKTKGLVEQQIYSVTTGMNATQKDKSNIEVAGKIDLILDNQQYQNLKFDISADGQKIVVQRVNRRNPGDFGIWVVYLPPKSAPVVRRLETQPGGDFIITPDSSAVAIAQGQGLAILPIPSPDKDASKTEIKPIDFLPQFGMVLSFTRDGSKAAMVKFNTDYTRSLYLVNNQGVKKEILKTTGSILNCQFHPQAPVLYCLLTQLLQKKEYEEKPYLAAIDLNTFTGVRLLDLPPQRDTQMSLSPDGLALIFDQLVTTEQAAKPNGLSTNQGQAIATSRLWLLPLIPSTSAPATQIQPEELPFPGFRPRWLP